MRKMSLQQLLELVRLKDGVLPELLAGHLLCAAVWRATVAGASLRPGMILLDAAEGMRLDLAYPPVGVQGGDPGYLAPEAASREFDITDPQVLVYAAGALGYELLTGSPPQSPPLQPRPELAGPVGEVVRVALAPSRVDRFHRLEEMNEALRAAHRAPAPEIEPFVFGALFSLVSLWLPEQRLSGPQPPDQIHRGEKETGELVRWTRSVDAALEDVHKQHLELILMLASHEVFSDNSAVRAANEGRSGRLQEQLELLQKIAAFAPAPTPAPRGEPRTGMTLWMSCTVALGAGAIAALAVTLSMSSRRPSSPAAAETENSIPQEQVAAAGPAPSIPPGTRGFMVLPAVVQPGPMPDDGGTGSSDAGALSMPTSSLPGARASRPQSEPRPAIERTRPPSRAAGRLSSKIQLDAGERALRQGRPEDALTAFKAVLAAEPDSPATVRGVAMVYMMQGKEKEAKEEFKRYLRLAPRASDAARIGKVIENLDVPAR